MQLASMYQEIILDHSRNPHGRGLREPFEAEVHHVNPTCGDEVTLRVHLDGDTLADVSYEGMGCSISQASVSAMYELVIGRSGRSEEHTAELQSRQYLVCRLLLGQKTHHTNILDSVLRLHNNIKSEEHTY